MFISSETTANGSDLEVHLAVTFGVGEETFDVLPDTIQRHRLDVLILGGNGEAVAVVTVALAEDRTPVQLCELGSTSSMCSDFIGSEDKDHLVCLGCAHLITHKTS